MTVETAKNKVKVKLQKNDRKIGTGKRNCK
jgi:hypothetical protein